MRPRETHGIMEKYNLYPKAHCNFFKWVSDHNQYCIKYNTNYVRVVKVAQISILNFLISIFLNKYFY